MFNYHCLLCNRQILSGLERIQLINQGKTITDDPEEFSGIAIKLYTDANAWKKAQAQGQHIARKRLVADQWLTQLPQLIEPALASLEENRKRNFIGRMLRHHRHRSTEYMSRWIEAKNQNARQ